MTVSTTSNRKTYTGNGSSTVFGFPYKFISTSDIVVYVAGVLQTSGYSVGTPTDSGANITFVSAPAALASIVILADPARTQATALPSTGPFPAKAVETGLDKLTLLVQRLYDLTTRSLTLSDSDASNASTVMPTPSANKLLGWDSIGAALQNVDPITLATIIAFGTANGDIFSGTGVQTAFTLSANPGALNNLDISIGGVTQRPGIDYTWANGTTLTFTTAPAAGTSNILVRYLQALPQGYTTSDQVSFSYAFSYAVGSIGRWLQDLATAAGAAFIGFKSAVTGALLTTINKKLNGLSIDIVADFGADPTGATDVGAAINAAITGAQLLLSSVAGAGARITAANGSKFKITTPVNLNNAAGLIFDFDGCEFIGDIDMFTWTTAVSNMQWHGGRFDSAAHTGRAFVGSTTVYLNGCSITGVTFSQSLAACIVATPINCDVGTGNFFGAPSAIGVGAVHRHLVLIGAPGSGTAVNNNTLGSSGAGGKSRFNGATAAVPSILIQNGTGNLIAGDIEANAGVAVQLTDAGITTFDQPHIEGNGGQYQVVAQCVGADANYYNRAINFFGGKIVPNSAGNTAAFYLDANSLSLNLYGVDGTGVTAGLTVTNSSTGLNGGIRNYSGCKFTGTFSLVGIVSTNSGSAGGSGLSVVDEGTGTNLLNIQATNGQMQTGTQSAAPYNSTTATAANMVVLSNGVLQRSTSALKYKTDVRNIEHIDISKFRPVRYKSKGELDDPDKDYFGLIADEVDASGVKELVTYGATGDVEGFQYERLTVVLLKDLQDLRADFASYKASHP